MHAGKSDALKLVYHPGYNLDLLGLEEAHPFDAHKYMRIIDSLLLRRAVTFDEIIKPDPITHDDLLLVHTERYIESWKTPAVLAEIYDAEYMLKLPSDVLMERVVKTFLITAGGTMRAVREALASGSAVSVGGGLHHAHTGFGHGFCLIADVAIAITRVRREGLAGRVAIVDLDVHQGDGNAVIFCDDPGVFTFSMHQEDIFPVPKAQSDLDVPFRAGIEDKEYLSVLDRYLPRILDSHRPDLVVVIGGSDVLKTDVLGGAQLTRNGILRRDEYVWRQCLERNIACAMVLAGGYAPDCPLAHVESIVNLIELTRNGADR